MRKITRPGKLSAALVALACTPTQTTIQPPAAPVATPQPPSDSAAAVAPAAPVPAAAPKPVAAPVKVASVEGITEYRLANGLQVLLFPDASKSLVTVNATYLVGSRHEAYGETGMAHLLEHLLFKGSKNHTDVDRELTEHGARANGSTWFDRTNYFETFNATEENLRWALDLESDRMVNSFVAKKDLDTEMTVVRNELESGENDPASILEERVFSTAFLWHNYGKSTIGARADLENVPIERLQAFYRKYYQPDNAVLIVSGKFDEAKTLAMIQERFGAIPKPERSLDKGNLLFPTYTAEPTQDGERLVTLRRTGDVQVMMAMYHVPSGAHEDFAAVDVLADWLGKEPAGPLYKAVVETKKASGVSAGSYQLREPGVLSVVAEVRSGSSLEEAQKAVLKVVEETALKGPTAEEVGRSKTALLKQFELQMNNPQSVGVGLSEWAAAGDWRLMFLHRDRIEKVTADDVKRVAGKYLKPSNRTLGQFIPTEKPERAEIPAAPDLAVVLKDYKGKAALEAGEDFVATVENIEARTTRGALSSGLKTAYLPKKTRGGQVRVVGRLRFGSEKALNGQAFNGLFAGQMLMRGTKKHTRQQIQDEFDRLKARAFVGGGLSSASFSIETSRENLIPVMRLVAEILKEPAFDAKEFSLLQEETLADLEESLQEPGSVAGETLALHLNPYPKGHPFAPTATRDDITAVKALKLADVKKFHASFYGASSGEIAVVGDFDAKEVNAALEETLGSWKSPQAFARIEEKPTSASPIDKDVDVADKANAVVTGALPFKLSDKSPDYPALVLANFLFGGGFLDSRLATRIRQKEGLSYGVGSSLSVSSWEEVAQLGFFAITAPENADKVEKAMREELDLVLKSGFTDDEMKKGKSGYVQNQEQNRVNDASLASALANSLYLGRTLTFQAELEKKLNALSKEDVLKVVQKYWVPSAFSIVKSGSFSKPPAAAK